MPSGFAIICAETTLIEASKKILAFSLDDPRVEQQFTYDTTFGQANKLSGYRLLYVSALVMKNIMLENDPIFPVIIMIHSTKEMWVHYYFFIMAEQLLSLKSYPMIPIITDRELSIRRSIEAVLDRQPLLCQKHILSNIESFLRKKTIGGSRIDSKSILNKVRKLMVVKGSNDEQYAEEFEDLVEKFWPANEDEAHPHKVFLDYFNANIRADLFNHAKPSYF